MTQSLLASAFVDIPEEEIHRVNTLFHRNTREHS